jgi:hypothetical protein
MMFRFLLAIAILIGALIYLLVLEGCCRYCKPDKVPPQVVEVPIACSLPPGPGLLPVPKRGTPCPKDWNCYDVENAAKLASRDGKLKQWIREAKARCTPKDAGVPDVDIR